MKHVDALTKIAVARRALAELCEGKRTLMSIPARPEHDADLLISDALVCAAAVIEEQLRTVAVG